MAFGLRSLFKPSGPQHAAHALYAETVLAARDPAFFNVWGVPDTVEGRFEVLCLRAFALLRRLKREPGAQELSQAYFDIMFDDLDSNLRELGVGDMGIGKKVKKLAGGFYGRVKAYDAALDAPDDERELQAALRRFLFRDAQPSLDTMTKAATFLRGDVAALEAQPFDALLAGSVAFNEVTA